MSIIDDIKKFLETRLEEFIRSNPQLELQLLDDQLQQQEQESLRLISEYTAQEKKLQEEILKIADEITKWHDRAQKAAQAGKTDLAQGAKAREADLLRQGNQVWAQMNLAKQNLQQAQTLYHQIKVRRQEVQAKIASDRKPKESFSSTWQNWQTSSGYDELEAKFRQWEMDMEIEQMKRKMGR
ncbi:MAG: TIGR04376 family protein [Pseudanabaenaceae cyanobacterium]